MFALQVCLVLLSPSAPAWTKWTVAYLHPPSASASYAWDVSARCVGGYAYDTAGSIAGMWTLPQGSWIKLGDTSAISSAVYGLTPNLQVGYFEFSAGPRACSWQSNSGSLRNIHPIGYDWSLINDAEGSDYVGVARFAGEDRAILWKDNGATVIDLSPPNSSSARAYGAASGKQVGSAMIDGVQMAVLWRGTTSSVVNLHPAGPFARSVAFGASIDQEVGSVQDLTNRPHAYLWSGSGLSPVDLHPTGALWSEAFGVANGYQVGYAVVDGVGRAGIWNGTASSWTDLHKKLRGTWEYSVARAVWSSGGRTLVAGYGYNRDRARVEALLWRDGDILDIRP